MNPKNDLNEKLDRIAQTCCCETCKELCGVVRELISKMESREHTVNNPDLLEQTVTDVLQETGVPAHLKGYQCLREAILIAVDDMEVIHAVTKTLYPAVAKRLGTTSSRVERAISHAIELAWDRGDLETQKKYFGNTICASKGKPTNGEFVATIADRLRMGAH